jgi:hypothetical protein
VAEHEQVIYAAADDLDVAAVVHLDDLPQAGGSAPHNSEVGGKGKYNLLYLL